MISHSLKYFIVRRGFERYHYSYSFKAYLQHFFDSIWLDRAILIDVCTEDGVCIGIFLTIFSNIVAQFAEDSLRHVCVQVVYKYSLRHNIVILFIFMNLI